MVLETPTDVKKTTSLINQAETVEVTSFPDATVVDSASADVTGDNTPDGQVFVPAGTKVSGACHVQWNT